MFVAQPFLVLKAPLIVKLKLPSVCSKFVSPKASPLFKARPEVVRDPVFKARLQEQYTVWEEARTVSHIPTLAWWEETVKPGVRNLLKWRGREMKKERLGRLNLFLLRQSYLVKHIQALGRNVAR